MTRATSIVGTPERTPWSVTSQTAPVSGRCPGTIPAGQGALGRREDDAINLWVPNRSSTAVTCGIADSGRRA